jgi:hypothetical protein
MLGLQRSAGNRATVSLLKDAPLRGTGGGRIQRLVTSDQFQKQTKLAMIKGKGKSKAEFADFVARLRRYEQMADAPFATRRQHLADLRNLLNQWLAGKGKTSSRTKPVRSLVLEISAVITQLDQAIHHGGTSSASGAVALPPAAHVYDDDADLVAKPHHYDDDADLVAKPHVYDDDADLVAKPHAYNDAAKSVAKPHLYDDDADLVDGPHAYNDAAKSVAKPHVYDDDGDLVDGPHAYNDAAKSVAKPHVYDDEVDDPPASTPGAPAAIPVPTGPAAAKYAKTKVRGEGYKTEFVSGLSDLPEFVGKPQWVALDVLARGLNPGTALKNSAVQYGWTAADIQEYRKAMKEWSGFLKLAQGAKEQKISQPQLVSLVLQLGWTAEECDKYLQPGISPLAAQMRRNFGWSQEDCDKYLPKVANMSDPSNPDRPLVTALKTEEERAEFQLRISGTVTQGSSTELYDTGNLFSKFMKQGWAIFVMDSSGRFFAAQHKVGLFHHSSFLAGGNVAGAGEIKIEGGRVKAITNKSGHYLPTAAEMVQVFAELESNGVDLATVDYYHLGSEGGLFDKVPKLNAKTFFQQQKTGSVPAT